MLSELTVQNFRNIESLTLYLHESVNIFFGENGSGKTSLLEAVFLIAMGRSFRTRSLNNVIQHNKSEILIFARTDDQTPVGLQFSQQKGLQLRLNSSPLKRLSDLATQIPLQNIPANCHQFFELGPKYRRQLLDWGVFHVKHDFNFHWQSYKKILSQRNAAIKKKQKFTEIELWDATLVEHGNIITTYREEYLVGLLENFTPLFTRLCPEFKTADYDIRYSQGWVKGTTFLQCLKDNLERDSLLGYTRNGIHSADWTIRINNCNPAETLSRGQQKLFYLAISIAQIKLIDETNDASAPKTVLLIDDLSSELDDIRQNEVLSMVSELPVQCFISSTEESLTRHLSSENQKVFHVKHGEVREV